MSETRHCPPTRWREQRQDDAQSEPWTRSLALLDVEPPPFARTRVWARLQSKSAPESAPKNRAWLATVPALVAAVALVWVQPSPRTVGRVGGLIGRAHVVRGASGVSDLEPGSEVGLGDLVATDPGARALLVGQGVRVVVEPGTQVEIGTLASGVALRLGEGSVVTEVEAAPGRAPRALLAGVYRLEVAGALFQVTRYDAEVTVVVRNGMVRVHGPRRADGARDVVEVTGTLSTGGGSRPEISRPALALLGLGEGRGPAIAGPGPTATVDTPRLDAQRGRAPIGPGRGAQVGAVPVLPDLEREPKPESAPNVPLLENSVAAPEPAGGDPAERLYRIAVETADHDLAIGRFDEVAALGEAWGEVAGYQAARRALRAKRADAAPRFAAFLSAFPQGTFAAEARLSLIALRVEAGDRASARAEIERFLVDHPDSERGAELRALRSELCPECLEPALP